MKFKITCSDGTVLNGDPSLKQRFEIGPSGVLTFFDAPEDTYQHTTAFSPTAWTKVSYVSTYSE